MSTNPPGYPIIPEPEPYRIVPEPEPYRVVPIPQPAPVRPEPAPIPPEPAPIPPEPAPIPTAPQPGAPPGREHPGSPDPRPREPDPRAPDPRDPGHREPDEYPSGADEYQEPITPVSATVDEDLWAWAHTTSPEIDPRLSNRQVALILVAHNGAEWLPAALKSISRLEHPPGAIIAVDATSADESRDLLNEAVSAGTVHLVVEAPPDQGFGAAVATAVERLPPGFSWLWLLHDDAQVQPDTLTALRTALDQQPRPDLIYPKLLLPRLRHHSDRISEIGESLTSTGERYLSIEPGDLDQRQTEPEITLGGSTCGLFIRRQAWRDLGGTDPGLPLFRDGLDLGWRANDVGLRVMTWPSAAIYHTQAGRGGMRTTTITRDPERLDLVLGMRVAVARSRHPGRTRFAAALRSLLRSVWLVLGRSPSEAARTLSALRILLSHPKATRELRRRHPHATDQAALRPTAWTAVRDLLERAASRLGDAVRDLRDEPETGLDDLIGDDYAAAHRGPRWARPGPVVGLAMVIVALVAARQGWGGGHLVSSQLLPAPDSLTEAWRAALRPMAGHPGANSPWLMWSAVGSTLAFGRPEFFVRALVLLVPLWSYLTATRAASRVIGPGWRPHVIGFAWAAAVVSSGVASRGSMAGAALAIMIPWGIGLCYQWWAGSDAGSAAEAWRAPAMLAALIAIAGSAYPLVFFGGVVVAAAMAVLLARERGARTLIQLDTWPGLLLVVIGPALVAAGWFVRLRAEPARLLTGPDPLALPAGPAPAWWQVLLARTVAGAGAGLPPWWVSLAVIGGLWVAVGYLIVRRAIVVPARHTPPLNWSPLGWSLTFIGFTMSAVLGRLSVQIGGVAVRGGTEPWILLGLAGLLVVAFTGYTPRPDGEPEQLKELAAPISLMLVVISLVGMLWWVVGAPSTPLHSEQSTLPAYVRDAHDPPRSASTLMVNVSGGHASWSLVSATRPMWGSGEGSDQLTQDAAAIAGQIASGTPDEELAARLTALGIAHVWMRGGSSDQVLALSNVPGLSPLSVDGNTVVWTVIGRVSRISIETGSQSTNLSTGVVEPGAAGRVLRIAAAPDPRWQVSVGGQALSPSSQPGGTQPGARGPVFQIGGATGPVQAMIARSTRESLVTALGLLILLIFAAPSAGRDRVAGGPRRARRTR